MFAKFCAPPHSDLPNVVLLACGAFSPPTIMHMRMMEMAREYLQSKLNVHIALGLFSPVHDLYEKPGLAPAMHRLRMVQIACQQSSWLESWAWECGDENPGWTRTAVVVKKLESLVNCPVILVAGSDILESFQVPGLWDNSDIAVICTGGLCVIERGTMVNELILLHPMLFKYRWNIHIVPQPIHNSLCSTKIRLLVSRGLSIAYLVHQEVEQYIEDNKLYQ